ncbi:MAG: Fic family protein, partial [Tepidisphaeraceae bacterium]
MAHKWQQILDLPSHWQSLISAELKSISSIWQEQHDRLRKLDSIQQFNDRLAREWAIETGIIENVYHIDRGVTVVLIEKGIEASLIPHGASDRPAEEVIQIVHDHQEALEGLFSFVKKRRTLSNSYIRELHDQMLKHQHSTVGKNTLGEIVEIELKRGQFKTLPNNPSIPGTGLHEYCPPEHVASEMDNLLGWHTAHLKMEVPVEIEAAWLHHRFTQIHPFQDGNGRIARALASLVFIRDKYFPLLITRDTRADYISALGAADNGDLTALVALFARQQKGSLLKALSLSEDVIRRTSTLNTVVDAAIGRLRQRREEVILEQRKVLEIAGELEEEAALAME